VSAATVRRELTLLGAVFEEARREWHWVSMNPVRDVRKPIETHSPERTTSRMRAPHVPPIEHAGVRYAQLQAPSSEGLPPGGYVVATEIASGKRLWIAQVFETRIDPNREADLQRVFFRSMVLSRSLDALEIEDEHGARYRIVLADGAVWAVR